MNQIPRLFVLLLVASTLSACATPADIRKQPPEMELKSALPAVTVSTCIATKWENAGPLGGTFPINMHPIEGGYTVAWVAPRTMVFADVLNTVDGSITRYFKNMVIGAGAFDQIVIGCQKSTEATTQLNIEKY